MSLNAPAGALLLGYTFSFCLYAVLTVQLYVYYAAFPRDPAIIKSFVYFIYLVETVKTGIMIHDLYATFVIGLADMDSLRSIRYIWLTCCVANGLLGFMVQMLYAYRVKVLSTSYFWGLCIALLAFLQLVGAIFAGIGGKLVGRLDETSTTEYAGYIVYKIGGATCDILIAVLMTYYLLRMKKYSSTKEDVITKIVRLVVGAGALTSVFAIVDFILYFTDKKDGSSWAFRLIVGKLYSNSMMVMFNSRFSVRNNRYNYDSGVTWKNSFSASTEQVTTQNVNAHVPVNIVLDVRPPTDHVVNHKINTLI